MHDYIAESLLHAAVTVAVLEPLLRLWRLSAPSIRLAARLAALAVPILITPVLLLAVPDRRGLAFRLDRALFDSSQWHAVTVGGIGVDDWAIAAASIAGLILFGRDVLALRGVTPSSSKVPAGAPETVRLARLGGPPVPTAPPLVLTADDVPLLFVRGSRHPRIVVSQGALDRLDDDELSVALAHERAHIAGGDVRLGWWLAAARLLQAFNPFVHVLARAAIVEMERRADRIACRDARAAALLSRARTKLLLADRLCRADFGPALPTGGEWPPTAARNETSSIGARAASVGVGAAVAVVSVLVFFVV